MSFANDTKILILLLLLLSVGVGGSLFSQSNGTETPKAKPGHLPTDRMKIDLARAEAFIVSYHNDSATLVLSRMLDELKEQGQLDSPFGLRAQLVQARALEHEDEDSTSLKMLLHVKGKCKADGLWDTYTKACLALALLYESIGLTSQCEENLHDAKLALQLNNFDSLYPLYAMRAASYHRVISNKVDSAIYFAQEVLRTAPRYNLILEEAWGHLLMAMLLNKTDDAQSLEHFKASIPLFKKIDDYTGLSYALSGITSKYHRRGDLKKALAYNDSTLAAANMAIAAGNKRHLTVSYMYRFRGELFRQMGQPDSAWHYLKKGYDLELEHVRATQNDKVIEIEARYQDEIKTLQLVEQAGEIQQEREQRILLLWLAFLLLLLIAALAFFYMKLRKANQKTHEQAEQLKTLDVAKSRFFANVSHELRTPLTLLLGPIQTLLKERQLTDTQSRLLQMANQSGQQLQQLVNEILDLQKLEAGKMELDEKPTALAQFFRRNAAQFKSLAQRKQIDFSFETSLDENLVAQIDQEKCRQILYNLLSNAFKFTPAGGQVKVEIGNWEIGKLGSGTIYSRESSISQFPISNFQISVSDTGPGIHPDDLPHVFDRFFQTTRPDKPAEGGTGIGLALCHEYAKLFGGKIEVESPDPRSGGRGSVFRISFPAKLAVNLQPAADDLEAEDQLVAPIANTVGKKTLRTASDASKSTLLVVEDSPELQDYIRLVLEEKYHVVTAENGQAALDILRDEGRGMRDDAPLIPSRQIGTGYPSSLIPDLIISDLMMPVMDGYQLLEKLKGDDATSNIPVIMLTARADKDDRLKALRIGVDDYLTKPFDEEELLVRIENLLKNKAARKIALLDETTEEKTAALPEADQAWLESFENHVRKNLVSDLLTIPQLAYRFAMSESTLLRQLKRLTGLTPQQYLQEMRLDQARHLLENRSGKSVGEVASEVGYKDTRSFSRSFRQRFGKLPSEMLGI